MAFFADGQGWIVTDDGVVHTEDRGRRWRDAAPPDSQDLPTVGESFFFLDGSRAWRLGFVDGQQPQAVVDATSDGGTNWLQRRIALDFGGHELGGAGSLFFLDERTGWLLVQAQTSSASSRAVLYGTSDGGVTRTKRSVPIAGTIRFATPSDDWVAGGPAGAQLHVTRDRGATWHAVDVPHRPADEPWHTTVAAPVVVDDSAAVLPVQVSLFTTSGEDDEPPRRQRTDPARPPTDPRPDPGSDLYFFVTDDRGRTWTPAGAPLQTAQLGDILHGTAPRLSVVDRDHWFLAADGLWATSDAGESWSRVDSDRDLTGAVAASFASPVEGWLYLEHTSCPPDGRATGASCATQPRLLHTTDGGSSWQVVALR